MFSKTIPASTITSTALNTAGGYTADPALAIAKRVNNGTPRLHSITMYPKGIQIVNTSGVDLEWLILSNADDVLMYADPSTYPYFAFTLLPKSAVLSNSNLPTCFKFIIQSVSGATATSGIRIDFNQYVGG